MREARIRSESFLEKIMEGKNVAYARAIQCRLVFADIWIKESITYHLYRLPKKT
jgi:hypothetical protein